MSRANAGSGFLLFLPYKHQRTPPANARHATLLHSSRFQTALELRGSTGKRTDKVVTSLASAPAVVDFILRQIGVFSPLRQSLSYTVNLIEHIGSLVVLLFLHR